MKNKSMLLTVLACAAVLYGIFGLLSGTTASDTVKPVDDLSQIGVVDIKEYRVLYIESLQVVERYAFMTMSERADSGGTYRVYDGAEPMDENELYTEYYTVILSDNTGKDYVASMAVAASAGMSDKLQSGAVTITACVGASPLTDSHLLNSWDEEQINLRESHLNACAAEKGLPRAGITLGYRCATVEDYQAQTTQPSASNNTFSVGFGAVALIGGIVLLIVTLRKNRTDNKE